MTRYFVIFIALSGCVLDGSPLPGEERAARGIVGFLDAAAQDGGLLEPDAEVAESWPDSAPEEGIADASGAAGSAAPEDATAARDAAGPEDAGPASDAQAAQVQDSGDSSDAATPRLASTCEPCDGTSQCEPTHLCLWLVREERPRCFPRKGPGDPTCTDWGEGLSTFLHESAGSYCDVISGDCERWLFRGNL